MPQNGSEDAGFPVRGEGIDAENRATQAINDYRARASKLRALAIESADPQIRTYLLTTAAQFDSLADYAAASQSPHAA